MNIVLIALDTQRADHLGCYGYPRRTSPHIDALAREGILFEHPVTNTAHTGPTFTTIYTGQYPFTHGIVTTLWGHPNEHDQLLDDTTPTLAECLRKAGWLTVAFDNLLIWPSHPAHFARGYDYYVHTLNPGSWFCAAVLAEQINARLLPFIETLNAKQPFFLFVHYWDPHQPYNEPAAWRDRHVGQPGLPEMRAANGADYAPRWGWKERLDADAQRKIDHYDAELSYVDEHVRQVCEALKRKGLYDDTTIIVTADHGEDMVEHNAPFEHREPYETTVRVPLIVKPSRDWPAAAPGRFAPQVGHIDLMPTILDLARVEAPQGMDGKSWLGALSNPAAPVHEELFITGGAVKQAGRWRAPELAVRTQTAKYIRRVRAWSEPTHKKFEVVTLCKPRWIGPLNELKQDPPCSDFINYFNSLPAEELYDLAQDPDETHNLIAERPEQAAQLRAALDRHIATNPERC